MKAIGVQILVKRPSPYYFVIHTFFCHKTGSPVLQTKAIEHTLFSYLLKNVL